MRTSNEIKEQAWRENAEAVDKLDTALEHLLAEYYVAHGSFTSAGSMWAYIDVAAIERVAGFKLTDGLLAGLERKNAGRWLIDRESNHEGSWLKLREFDPDRDDH